MLYLFALPSSSEGAIHVTVDGAGDKSGDSWANAMDTAEFRTALEAATPGEYWVAAESYTPTTDGDRAKSFVLSDGVALYGGFTGTETAREQRDPAANPTILTGDLNGDDGADFAGCDENSYHVVWAVGVDSTAVLDGFIVTGGNANGSSSPHRYGGGMYNEGGSPTIANCVFSGNSSGYGGGGMYNEGGSSAITNCVFSGNRATNYGGGMYNDASSPEAINCTFSGNSAFNGGGMGNYGSNPTIANCTFSGNSTTNYGGGIWNNGSSPVITNCTFSGNSAPNGGGMYNVFGAGASNPVITNCTFSGNSASSGGGMSNQYLCSPVVTNSIFWASSGGEIYYDPSSSPTLSYCVVQGGYAGTGNTDADPKLGPLADNGGPTQTHAPGAGSSAIGAGTSTGAPDTDQRGVARPQGSGYDIGAYEAEVGSLTVIITPGRARTDGARWSFDGGAAWRGSGEAVDLAPGSYTVIFKAVGGWTKPANRNAAVTKDQATVLEVEYAPAPAPMPTPNPTPTPTPTPAPTPTPMPVQPVDPPVVPPDTPLPEGSHLSVPTPLVVSLPPNPTPEQKKEAIKKVLSDAGVPAERIEFIVELLDVDDAGQVYITAEGMNRLRELLDDLDIPEGAESSPLTVFRAVLDAQGNVPTASGNGTTAIVFFRIPEGFIGKRSDRLQVVKMLSSESAEVFERVYALEDLRDGCVAVVEVETVPGGTRLKRVLEAEDLIDANSRITLAIQDGGRFDLDGTQNGGVTDPAFILEAEKKPDPDDPHGGSGGGGCTVGGPVSPMLLTLLAPLALLACGRRR